MRPELVWIATAVLILTGVAGSILPAVPGAPLILVAAVLHRCLLPGWVSWWTIAALSVLAALSFAVDAVCGVLGARRFGGGRWALLGAVLGAAAGLLVGTVARLALALFMAAWLLVDLLWS